MLTEVRSAVDDLVEQMASYQGESAEADLSEARLRVFALSTADLYECAALHIVRRVRKVRRDRVAAAEREAARSPGSTWHVSPAEEQAREARFCSKMAALIAQHEVERVIEWSEYLLLQSFAVGDVRVTWGRATVAQHAARLEWLTKHASSTATTAQRHATAIRDIRALSCVNLNQAAGLE